jgi:hypothetical protein
MDSYNKMGFHVHKIELHSRNLNHLTLLKSLLNVCMYKGWAIKLALAPRPLMIYCASPLAAAMIVTVAALRSVLALGSKPT